MENIIKSIVMLIDMYYHRKRLIKRWKSIKRYQRTGIIDNKSTVLPVNKQKYNDNDLYELNANILSYLNSVGAKANIIHNKYDIRDLVAIEIIYKNYRYRFEYSDYFYKYNVIQYAILDHIKAFIKQTDLKIEEHRKLLHNKNNPHSLKIGNKYLVRYSPYTQTHFDEITIDRFTDLCFPWSNKLGGILSPNMYDIKTIDGKWIHNCKQWDEFQAKKKLINN